MLKELGKLIKNPELIMALCIPPVVAPAVLGIMSWVYRDQIYPLLKVPERPPLIFTYEPEVASLVTAATPSPIPAPDIPRSRLYYHNDEFFTCIPIGSNVGATASNAMQYLNGGESVASPYHVIIRGRHYSAAADSELLEQMLDTDLACLPLVR